MSRQNARRGADGRQEGVTCGREATAIQLLTSLHIPSPPFTDLAVAAGFAPAALLCELVDPSDDQGGIAARDSCLAFAREHNLRITSIEKLRKWREEREGDEFEGKSVGAANGIDEERGVKMQTQAVAPPAAESA